MKAWIHIVGVFSSEWWQLSAWRADITKTELKTQQTTQNSYKHESQKHIMMEGIEIAFNLQPFPHKTFKLLSGCREGRTGSVNSEQGQCSWQWQSTSTRMESLVREIDTILQLLSLSPVEEMTSLCSHRIVKNSRVCYLSSVGLVLTEGWPLAEGNQAWPRARHCSHSNFNACLKSCEQ